jgi:CDP-diacylglycerol--glycerol-3-phosphate 3-phosphatidyltransferase
MFWLQPVICALLILTVVKRIRNGMAEAPNA